jgi:type IV secretion system protein TrbD
MERAREVMIHQSANRPNLLLGCDREMILFVGLISAILAFALSSWWGVMTGIALWVAAVAVLSRVGKADPLMRKVYVRHVRYQTYYPASARPTGTTLVYPEKW